MALACGLLLVEQSTITACAGELITDGNFACSIGCPWNLTGSARVEPTYPGPRGLKPVLIVNNQGDQGTVTQVFTVPNGGGQYKLHLHYKLDGAVKDYTSAFVVIVAGNPVLCKNEKPADVIAQAGNCSGFPARVKRMAS
jgi:hypothetical protein